MKNESQLHQVPKTYNMIYNMILKYDIDEPNRLYFKYLDCRFKVIMSVDEKDLCV